MVDWLYRSFEEHSIFWLITSGVIGGIITLALKFFFEDILKKKLEQRRTLNKIVKHYSSPLLRTGFSLERKVNGYIRDIDKGWYENTDPYYKLSLLYGFGEFLAWIRILEREKNFLEFSRSKKTKDFEKRLHGIFRAITSFAYFRHVADADKVDQSLIPRLYLTAIGEMMIADKEGDYNVLDFTTFCKLYQQKEEVYNWFQALDIFLTKAKTNELTWDRLIMLQTHLKHFCLFLDKEKSYIRNNEYRNLELMKDATARKALLKHINILISFSTNLDTL
ncbi:MAG: hypothetical protein MI974_29050 [Chitinophagales bacterium]|nr:hypothetical protein [Chitinophagales bacterium]